MAEAAKMALQNIVMSNMQGSSLSAPLCVQVVVRGVLEEFYGDGSRGVKQAAADALTSLASLAKDGFIGQT